LTLLSAVAIYDVTNRLHRVIRSKVDLNLQFLLTSYEKMCVEVNGINEINSKVMLVVYVRLLSWLSQSSVDVLEPSNWLIKVHLLIYYIFYSSIFILAAEANRQVSLQLKISDFFPSWKSIRKFTQHALKSFQYEICGYRQTLLNEQFGSFTRKSIREGEDHKKAVTIFQVSLMARRIIQ